VRNVLWVNRGATARAGLEGPAMLSARPGHLLVPTGNDPGGLAFRPLLRRLVRVEKAGRTRMAPVGEVGATKRVDRT